MLFESYFNQVSQLSDEIQKMIESALDASKYTATEQGIDIKVDHPKYPLVVKFNMLPDKYDESMLALMRNLRTSTRSSVQLKNGQNRRRILPVPGGTLSLNVANLVDDRKRDIPFYSKLAPYIHKVDDDIFEFINLSIENFARLCRMLMNTSAFKGTISHEIQHKYNPLAHRRVITSPSLNKKQKNEISKVAASIYPSGKITKNTLNYTKYASGDDEVNSSVAEAIAAVRHNNSDGAMFASESPKDFINECVAFLKKINRWKYYTPDVRRKVIRRLSQTFYDLRQPSRV